MPLNDKHIEEICDDIRNQYESGVTTCALFQMTLVPEGTPVVDKVTSLVKKYKLFKTRLDAMGVKNGVLVQATIGHGRKLNELSPFTKYEGIVPGTEADTYCPFDDDFCNHMRGVFAAIAEAKPAAIMVDDDFRLMGRRGSGCACRLHLAAINKKLGKNFTKDELYAAMCADEDGSISEAFVQAQGEALLKAARAMREGIDSVDPTIPGSYCGCDFNIEFAEDIAKILAGEGNPITVRINNGNYTPAGARKLSFPSYRAAIQAEHMKGKVDVILAETDTCPQNRYSTGAQSLHSHFTASILEGCAGAKHWLTRNITFEPNSGRAYRRVLAKNRGFYEALSALVPSLEWQGCRIPLTVRRVYKFENNGWGTRDGGDGWSTNVLERLGLPLYFSSKKGGAVFLADKADRKFSDEEIREMLSGVVFLSGDSARRLAERGFLEYIGVEAREWRGKKPSRERLYINGKICNAPIGFHELVPVAEGVVEHSMVIHAIGDVLEEPLFPGVTSYRNSLGGFVVVFTGTPITEFNYMQAFSLLNESRKAQIVSLLSEAGCLPVYYEGDEELYFRAAKCPDGSLFTCLFNMGFDPIEEIILVTDAKVSAVEMLKPDGEWQSVSFMRDGNRIIIDAPVYTLNPVALILKV